MKEQHQEGTIVEELDTETQGIAVHTFDLDDIANERRTPDLYGHLMTLDGRV